MRLDAAKLRVFQDPTVSFALLRAARFCCTIWLLSCKVPIPPVYVEKCSGCQPSANWIWIIFHFWYGQTFFTNTRIFGSGQWTGIPLILRAKWLYYAYQSPYYITIHHFRVTSSLCFKARLSAKPLKANTTYFQKRSFDLSLVRFESEFFELRNGLFNDNTNTLGCVHLGRLKGSGSIGSWCITEHKRNRYLDKDSSVLLSDLGS